jgi:hypothetical protein
MIRNILETKMSLYLQLITGRGQMRRREVERNTKELQSSLELTLDFIRGAYIGNLLTARLWTRSSSTKGTTASKLPKDQEGDWLLEASERCLIFYSP